MIYYRCTYDIIFVRMILSLYTIFNYKYEHGRPSDKIQIVAIKNILNVYHQKRIFQGPRVPLLPP